VSGPPTAASDSQPGSYCHRSLNAWIKVVAIQADAHINLACSGADSSNLTSGQPGQYGEPSQADRLASVAKPVPGEVHLRHGGRQRRPGFRRHGDALRVCP
jgi:hypothetical protein